MAVQRKPRHESQVLTLREIIDRMEPGAGNWTDVMMIDIPGLSEAEANGEQDEWEEASRIESEYLKQHANDKYEVRWPEHVTYPRFNSDASYLACGDE